MKDKYTQYNKTVDALMEKGYTLTSFFFQIGNFEDEDDIQILTKNGIALFWDYVSDKWYGSKFADLHYSKGYPHGEPIDINSIN